MGKQRTITPYMNNLSKNRHDIQKSIELLIQKYQVLPVGKGYIDLIILRSNVVELIDELMKLSVAVESVSWWCLCLPETKDVLGCPHGGGGPGNQYGDGWFSECYHYPFFEVEKHGIDLNNSLIQPATLAKRCGQIVSRYLTDELPSEPFFRDCLHPGLWLHVLEEWERVPDL